MKFWGKEEEPIRITFLGLAGLAIALTAFLLSDWVYYFGSDVPDITSGRTYLIQEESGARHYIWSWLGYASDMGVVAGIAVLCVDATLGHRGFWPDDWIIDFEKIEFRLPVATSVERWMSWLLSLVFAIIVLSVAAFGALRFYPADGWWFKPAGVIFTGFVCLTPVLQSKVKYRVTAFLAGLCMVGALGGLKILLDDRIALFLSPILLVLGLILFVREYRALWRISAQ